MNRKKIALFWSGGKDAALSLHKLLNEEEYELTCLVTTFSGESGRSTMHGIHPDLIRLQVKEIGIPLLEMWMQGASNNSYEKELNKVFDQLKEKEIFHVAFGDIALVDLKAYRDKLLTRAGMQGIYPLWKMDTKHVVQELEEAGIKSIICCLNTGLIAPNLLGEVVCVELAKQFDNTVDWAGENGEYHTFCVEAPYFNNPVKIRAQEIKTVTYSPKKSTTLPVKFDFLEIVVG